jgi:hypothetical protein
VSYKSEVERRLSRLEGMCQVVIEREKPSGDRIMRIIDCKGVNYVLDLLLRELGYTLVGDSVRLVKTEED